MALPNPNLTTPGDPASRAWLSQDRDGERYWLVFGTRKIAYVRAETVQQLAALDNGFGPRELVSMERLSVHR